MPGATPLDLLPLWGLFVATLLFFLLSIEGGYRMGRDRRQRAKEEKDTPVGGMVGATLGLFAFLLAFTFGFAATRFEARQQLVLDEANAVRTTYLRAELLSEPHRKIILKLLREYVDLRLEIVRTGKLAQGIRRSEELHDLLWQQAAAVARAKQDPTFVGPFIQSLTEVINIHAKRALIAQRGRIPGTIWAALYVVGVIALGVMGYYSGLAGTSRSLALLAVAIAFSAVMWLIANLDRPREGSLKVSQQPLMDVRKIMIEPKP